MSVLDWYRQLLGGEGGEQPPAGFGQDSLTYLDDVLSGRQPYQFDRSYAVAPPREEGFQAQPLPAASPDAGTFMRFAEDQTLPQTADVGTGIPLSLDRTPVNDPYTGTAIDKAATLPLFPATETARDWVRKGFWLRDRSWGPRRIGGLHAAARPRRVVPCRAAGGGTPAR